MILKMTGMLWLLLSVGAGMVTAQGDPQHAFDPATAAARKPGTTLRVDLIGDSTQTDNAGYGRGFCANLTAKVDCLNMAKGGASTGTFREQGLWDHALATKPDYMVIQFGHNDMVDPRNPMPRQVPLPDYIANLKRFVTEARAAGIKPVLCTPLTRRYFQADGKIHSDLTEYSEAMRNVAKEMKVPLIDLQADSIAYLDKVGEAEGNKLAITKKDDDGKTIFDKTHLDWAGSYVFGRMVAVDLGKAAPELAKYVRSEPAKLPPEGVKAMAVINGAPVRIVLVGDSTVASGGGWGPGFCAVMTPNVTCIDDALNGRSSKSFIDEGAWKKALDEKGDYYLIQFGHNDQKTSAALYTDPNTTFQANLSRYIADVRAIGAVPVLVTSLSRRNYKDGVLVEDLTPYVQAAKKVAADEYITLIDLNAMSVAMLKHMTQEQADKFDKGVDPDTGKAAAVVEGSPTDVAVALATGGTIPLDRTHLNPHGQKVFGRLVADAIVRTQVELGPDLIGEDKSEPQRRQSK
jgi:lysophospholipase L1-like esterase